MSTIKINANENKEKYDTGEQMAGIHPSTNNIKCVAGEKWTKIACESLFFFCFKFFLLLFPAPSKIFWF